MASAVTWWRLPEEEEDFITFLESADSTLALPLRTFERKEDVVFRPVRDVLTSDDFPRVLLTPASLAQQAEVIYIDTPLRKGYTVSQRKSQVLFYSRGQIIKPNVLSSSAVSADWDYLTEDESQRLRQPEEFVKWGKKIMQWVKKKAPGWHQHKNHLVTPKAEAARATGLELKL